MKLWYAITDEDHDGYDLGTSDYTKAREMLRENGRGSIVVLDVANECDPFCVETIDFDDLDDSPVICVYENSVEIRGKNGRGVTKDEIIDKHISSSCDAHLIAKVPSMQLASGIVADIEKDPLDYSANTTPAQIITIMVGDEDEDDAMVYDYRAQYMFDRVAEDDDE